MGCAVRLAGPKACATNVDTDVAATSVAQAFRPAEGDPSGS